MKTWLTGNNTAAAYASFYGKKFCMEISPYESIFITQVAIDGTPYPSANDPHEMDFPDEGYVLAPQYEPYSAARAICGLASMMSAPTWSLKVSKFFTNMATSFRAWAS